MSAVGFGTRISQLAAADGDRPAVSCGGVTLSRAQLESAANRAARLLLARGVGAGDLVTLALPNGVPLVVHCVAAWKIGAVPNPISHRLPALERDAILERADPALVVVAAPDDSIGRPLLVDGAPLPDDDSPLPDAIAPHERALASGGSTGTPKLILVKRPAAFDDAVIASPLWPRGCVLVPGPLYHAAPFGSLTQALVAGVEVVVMERFDAAACLELVERHRVEQVLFVPTMMHRIWQLPAQQRLACDVSSLRVVFSGGAPCPPWLMRSWIDWLGADVMHDIYGPSERIGGTLINGREWLAHPGSVGKPTAGARIRILDPETLRELPAGKTGEVFMMPRDGAGSTYRYVGAEGRRTADGWESVGDMGYVDGDGYLYLTDRRTDMILCGGRNVYPAQIEAAIDAFPGVLSSAVIGLPDDDLGNRIHAIVQTPSLDEAALRAHLARHLTGYCIPHGFERVDEPLRDEAGKVKRYKLRQRRIDVGEERGVRSAE